MIVENGAALLIPAGHLSRGVPGTSCDGDHHVLALGPGREALGEELTVAAGAAAVTVRFVSDLAAPERLRLSGPEALSAGPAAAYEYTEPFLLERESDLTALQHEAARRGLRIVRGPRYWHLCGGADKGLAVRTLLSLYEREGPLPKATGLGAWPTDVPMLRAVHRALLLPAFEGTIRPELAAEFPRAVHAPQGGPQGWSDALIALLAGREQARAPGTLARTA
jgi:mannosyl-3-phosphoglycerate phosphatase